MCFVHDGWPASPWNRPLSHSLQLVRLGSLVYLPRGHFVHTPSPVMKFPGEHGTQKPSNVSAQLFLCSPPGHDLHARHALCAACGWYRPTAQSAHTRSLVASPALVSCLPAEHVVLTAHAVRLPPGRKLDAPHVRHALVPDALWYSPFWLHATFMPPLHLKPG